MVTSRMTLCMTLVMVSPPVVHNSVPRERITCSNVSCDRLSSNNCPLWHFCNPRTGQCRPCGSCRDAEDNARYQTATLNCRDPMYCVTNYDFLPEHLCPRLRVKGGYQCSGHCALCGHSIGHFLGTVCRLSCSDGDSEVFVCTFLNEMAQWNITRAPLWLEIDNPGLTSEPSNSEDVMISERSVHHEAVYAPPTSSPTVPGVQSNPKFEFSTVVLVLAVISVVVVTTVVGVVVAAIICRRRQKKARSPEATQNTEVVRNLQEEQRPTSVDPALRPNVAPDDNNNNNSTEQQNPRRSKEPDEVSDRSVDILEEEHFTVVHPQVPERRNVPTQNSDTHCSSSSSSTQSAAVQTEQKNRNNSYCFDRLSSGSAISLHSDRENSPQTQTSHPNRLRVNYLGLNTTNHQDKADNRWQHICYRPLNVDDETPQKYV